MTSWTAPPASKTAAYGVSSGLGGGHAWGAADDLVGAPPPQGDLRRICNVCRGDCTSLPRHPFYHQLCPRCGDFNFEKRKQTANMHGMVAVVTGARVRIGYATAIKLLRAGATVVTTTRYPQDAALRYSQEPDFGEWSSRLRVVGPLELSDLRLVEAFCDALLQEFPRIHVLINNAAQTLTRPAGWHVRMAQLEQRASEALPPAAAALVSCPVTLASHRITSGIKGAATAHPHTILDSGCDQVSSPQSIEPEHPVKCALHQVQTAAIEQLATPDASRLSRLEQALDSAGQLADFPARQLDESRQPLDLSGLNSWSRRLGEISTLEVAQTLAANAAAPFVLCNRLAPALRSDGTEATAGCSHVINVTAVEGKFSVGKKSHAHPHTNMGKAALNMLTFTSAASFYQSYRILMNSVDTGWVTDMAPRGVGVMAARHATHVGPPLDEEDGAARVLDPVFSHLRDRSWRVRGHCFRNYFIAGW
jgi:NAD(P)-dependent dehydrogenase (short-subunit alcohol dehydrogenase family)